MTTQIMFKRGTAVYPALQHAETKFKEAGQYKADLVFPEADAKPYIDIIKKFVKEQTGKPHMPRPNAGGIGVLFYYPIDDDGNETGEVRFNLRANNIVKKDGSIWEKKPLVIDGNKQPTSADAGGGSILSVKAELKAFQIKGGTMAVRMTPVAVQINKLVERKAGEGMPDISDFDDDDGFVDNGVAGFDGPEDGDDDY